jgi:plastocyanin
MLRPVSSVDTPYDEGRSSVWVRIAVVAAVAALGSAGAAMAFSSATPTLKGAVGPGFTISLTSAKGAKVKTLKAGTYRFQVSDRANIHNFALVQKSGGKGRKVLTGVDFTGKKTVTVKLAKGKWEFYCQVHPDSMFGTFTVK